MSKPKKEESVFIRVTSDGKVKTVKPEQKNGLSRLHKAVAVWGVLIVLAFIPLGTIISVAAVIVLTPFVFIYGAPLYEKLWEKVEERYSNKGQEPTVQKQPFEPRDCAVVVVDEAPKVSTCFSSPEPEIIINPADQRSEPEQAADARLNALVDEVNRRKDSRGRKNVRARTDAYPYTTPYKDILPENLTQAQRIEELEACHAEVRRIVDDFNRVEALVKDRVLYALVEKTENARSELRVRIESLEYYIVEGQ